MNRKRRPAHPGALLREVIMPETGLTQRELAQRLGVSRLTVNEIVNERRALTPDMAYRLARVFNTTPQLWLNMQQAIDMWEAWHTNRTAYSKIKAFDAAAS